MFLLKKVKEINGNLVIFSECIVGKGSDRFSILLVSISFAVTHYLQQHTCTTVTNVV